MKQLSASKALLVPSDAAGLTFRIQPSTVLEAQFNQLGATPRVLPFAEVFDALKSGKVQGAENPWSNIYSKQLHSVQPFITETNHGVLDYMLVSNPRFWYAIPHQIRMQLEGIIDEVTFEVNRQAEAANQADRERIAACQRHPGNRPQRRTARRLAQGHAACMAAVRRGGRRRRDESRANG